MSQENLKQCFQLPEKVSEGFFYYNKNVVVYCIISNHITHYQTVLCNSSGFFSGMKCHIQDFLGFMVAGILDFYNSVLHKYIG